MNEKTKLILVFVAGVVVGVLGATSTLFQGEPEPSTTEIVTSDRGDASTPGTGAEAVQSAAESSVPPTPVAQAAAQTQYPDSDAEAIRAQAQPDEAQAEPAEAVAEEAEQAVVDSSEALADAAQESGERIFCMMLESSGRCQCYDAESMAPADVSDAECRAQLAEE